MKIINRLEDKRQPGWLWFIEWLSRHDLSKLASFSVSDRTTGNEVTGVCEYPKKGRKLYRIKCRVPGRVFPQHVAIRKSPIYRNVDGSWNNPPEGCYVSGYKRLSNGKEWNQIVSILWVTDLDEAIVWICGHEVFHFLRRTKQVPGRNTEIQADQFATDLLGLFRSEL